MDHTWGSIQWTLPTIAFTFEFGDVTCTSRRRDCADRSGSRHNRRIIGLNGIGLISATISGFHDLIPRRHDQAMGSRA